MKSLGHAGRHDEVYLQLPCNSFAAHSFVLNLSPQGPVLVDVVRRRLRNGPPLVKESDIQKPGRRQATEHTIDVYRPKRGRLQIVKLHLLFGHEPSFRVLHASDRQSRSDVCVSRNQSCRRVADLHRSRRMWRCGARSPGSGGDGTNAHRPVSGSSKAHAFR